MSDIQNSSLYRYKINCSDNEENQLTPGTILLFQTDDDRYGKLEILEYGNIFKFRYVIYTTNGDIFTQRATFSVMMTWYCNLDYGVNEEKNADFWLQQVNATERYLVPQNGAKFALLSQDTDALPTSDTPVFIFQEISSSISKKRGLLGSYLSHENHLRAGDNITGSIQINATSGDIFDVTWYFQIVDPEGDIERSWEGCQNLLECLYQTELNFNHAASKSGLYKIRIINRSSSSVKIYLNICPSYWSYCNSGTAQTSWNITK